MNKTKHKELVLPALRGVMGNWVFYSCLMPLDEISARVNYAEEIHNNKNLSDMIQRSLRKIRSEQIAKYIETQDERFFNSLVIATYGGNPNWLAVDRLDSEQHPELSKRLEDDTINSVGFLTLDGTEKLFAIDGQHRLSGMKKALKGGLEQDPYDDLSVIFVSHKDTAKGLQRTRRLFTTLNKTAKPVSKGGIIALDEDDVMAICVRRLIEETKLFSGERIAFVASNNMPPSNLKSLTTIGNLYDVLTLLFTKVKTDLKESKENLQRARPDDETLDRYFKLAQTYFKLLGRQVKPLAEFFAADEPAEVVRKYRGSHGGDALFRPIGLVVFTEVVVRLSQSRSLESAVKLSAKLPTSLTEVPFEGLMWSSASERIDNSNKLTLRETLLYMVGECQWKDAEMLGRYRRGLGDGEAELPPKVA